MKSLDDSCLKYIGETLYVETQYGWGWAYPENEGKETTNTKQFPIPSFTFKLLEFTSMESDERRGGIGIIADDKCKYNNFILEFVVRVVGTFDFSENYPTCNLLICQTKDHENITYPRKGIGGYGVIKAQKVS